MKNYITQTSVDGDIYPVTVTPKPIKRLHLKVTDGKISVSAPVYASKKAVDDFVKSSEKWISKRLKAQTCVRNDEVTYLGKKYPIRIETGRKGVNLTDDAFIIYEPQGDENKAKKIFYEYWKAEALKYFTAETKKAFVDFLPLGLRRFPEITVAKVKGYWGKCFKDKNKISYNVYLMQAEESYCRYVVYHELTHFLHCNHGKKFYETLEKVYPYSAADRKRGKLNQTIMWFDLPPTD